MKVVAIIQARMGSTRLPGKVLKKIMNKTLLAYQLERVRQSLLIDEIVIATTKNDMDHVIAEFCERKNINVYKGSEYDVLDRYYKAASKFKADVIVRLTSDCPLIDSDIIDEVIQLYLTSIETIDYASNTLERSFPRGLDVEVFSFEALEEAYQKANLESEREHVTPYIYNKSNRFTVANLKCREDLSNHRWTVDTIEDFELIKRIIEVTYPDTKNIRMQQIVEILERNPSWLTINAHIEQKKL